MGVAKKPGTEKVLVGTRLFINLAEIYILCDPRPVTVILYVIVYMSLRITTSQGVVLRDGFTSPSPLTRPHWLHSPTAPRLTLQCSRLQRANRTRLQSRDGVPRSRRRPVAVLTTSSWPSPRVQLTLTHGALPSCRPSALLNPVAAATRKAC